MHERHPYITGFKCSYEGRIHADITENTVFQVIEHEDLTPEHLGTDYENSGSTLHIPKATVADPIYLRYVMFVNLG